MPNASSRRFRHATMQDYPQMERIYAHARELMARNGNPTQWGNTFPRPEVVRDDIANHRTILLVDTVGGHERILAQFAVCPGLDHAHDFGRAAGFADDTHQMPHVVTDRGEVHDGLCGVGAACGVVVRFALGVGKRPFFSIGCAHRRYCASAM